MDALALGLSLGLGAGLAPGPLLVLVVGATLCGGFAAGARVAAAPLLSDAPIVALCVLVLRELPEDALAALSLAGAVVVGRLALEALREPDDAPAGPPRGELRRAVVVNALSPHPWLFWLTAGGPLLVDAGDRSVALAVAFLAGFYATLVGAKVALAGLATAGRERVNRRRGAVRIASAVLLSAGAVALLVDALTRLAA